MLGRNHALYAAAVWVGAYPVIAESIGILHHESIAVLGVTTAIAAGAGVVPDLDHPDARPSQHFGLLTKVLSKTINSASGGHRVGTHSIMFAVLIGAVAWAAQFSPYGWGRIAAVLACGFCASVGLALVGPSLGFRVPAVADFVVGIGVGWWVWAYFDVIKSALWVLAAGGVIVHCLCDGVTKGGVPFLFPFKKDRYGLGWFRVSGPGETVASFVGVIGLLAASWRMVLLSGAV